MDTMIPLAAVSQYQPGHKPLSVSHQGLFAASTISFNLRPGSIARTSGGPNQWQPPPSIHMPGAVHGTFSGHGAAVSAGACARSRS